MEVLNEDEKDCTWFMGLLKASLQFFFVASYCRLSSPWGMAHEKYMRWFLAKKTLQKGSVCVDAA